MLLILSQPGRRLFCCQHEKSRVGVLSSRLQLLEANDWSSFTVNSFSGRHRPRVQQEEDPLAHKFKRVTQLAKAGEFSRAYRALI